MPRTCRARNWVTSSTSTTGARAIFRNHRSARTARRHAGPTNALQVTAASGAARRRTAAAGPTCRRSARSGRCSRSTCRRTPSPSREQKCQWKQSSGCRTRTREHRACRGTTRALAASRRN
uniref:(northern house mosquito) hypothetical protein n=1 Tax=Culex pipiens TaxID=7175 RepID=A0A8D8A9P1_CULPI